MKFEQTVVLLGVVGKKGNGTLDNGQQWATDRVELHCLSEFPEANAMSVGKTVVVYNVENYSANFEKAKGLVDQEITLQMEMQTSLKIGATPKIFCTGFYGALPVPAKKSAPVLNSSPA